MTTTTGAAPAKERGSARVAVQKFGTFLSNMVMPNIAAFIAWGLITALFIYNGWLNGAIPATPGDEGFAGRFAADSWVAQIGGWGDFDGGGIVGVMITYLLPVLIAYTGGHMMYQVRGGVVGAIAAMGVIAGTDIPMFMGAMIMGPLGGWSMKKLDALWDGKIRPGFEMLVNNFSAGIWGGILAFGGFFVMSPIVTAISDALGNGVQWLVDNGLLPLTSILIEPAKILFLNNAINHGVLTPLGTAESLETGQSILFLLEANPGPGFGLLLAFAVAGTGLARASAPGAMIIQFFGGIHEIYFPYVLAKPRLIIALILGGMTGVFMNVLFDSGLRAAAAPGSIIAVYAMTAPGSFVGVTLSVVCSATVTFLVAAFLLRIERNKGEVDLAAATAEMESMKGKKSSVASTLTASAAESGPIKKIVFACDAGMGSSAMGASVLRRKIQKAGHGHVTVVNKAISNLEDEWDLVVTHRDLTDRAKQRSGSAIHVSVENFMESPRYDDIVELIDSMGDGGGAHPRPSAPEQSAPPAADGGTATATRNELLVDGAVVLTGTATTQADAINEAGNLLVAQGYVTQDYVTSMHERETSVSTYMGEGLAIPHGTNEAKGEVRSTGLSFVRYPGGVEWGAERATFVIGIAAVGDEHLSLLQKVAVVFADSEAVARLERATTPTEVRAVLEGAEG